MIERLKLAPQRTLGVSEKRAKADINSAVGKEANQLPISLTSDLSISNFQVVSRAFPRSRTLLPLRGVGSAG